MLSPTTASSAQNENAGSPLCAASTIVLCNSNQSQPVGMDSAQALASGGCCCSALKWSSCAELCATCSASGSADKSTNSSGFATPTGASPAITRHTHIKQRPEQQRSASDILEILRLCNKCPMLSGSALQQPQNDGVDSSMQHITALS